MRCATHPDVETNLTCSKCGKPICPRCMVQTPVGFRCRTCAGLTRLPTFRLQPTTYVKAAFTGLGAALAGGVVWMLITSAVAYVSYFEFIISGAIGLGIGEAISRAVNRKRATSLKVIAGLSAFLAYLVGNEHVLLGQFRSVAMVLAGLDVFSLFGLLTLAAGVYMAISRL